MFLLVNVLCFWFVKHFQNQNPCISPTEGTFTLLQQKRAKDSLMLPKKHADKSIKDKKIIIKKVTQFTKYTSCNSSEDLAARYVLHIYYIIYILQLVGWYLTTSVVIQ